MNTSLTPAGCERVVILSAWQTGQKGGGGGPYLAAMWHFTVAHIQSQSYTYVHPYA